jgi:hypothetical protein
MDRREFMSGASGLGLVMAIRDKTVIAAELPSDLTEMSASTLSAAIIAR